MSFLKFIWKKWLSFAKPIGNFQLQVLFSIFYLIFLSILGIIFRFFKDPLDIKRSKNKHKKLSNFTDWVHPLGDLDNFKNQF